MGKPSRSDELLAEEEQLRITQEVQHIFEAAAPNRPHRPERSDPSAPFETSAPGADQFLSYNLPDRLQELASYPALPLPVKGGVVSGDDYEETNYYKELHVDGEHRETGSGYIRVEIPRSDCLHLDDVVEEANSNNTVSAIFKCNPATNEWEPSPDLVIPASAKPPRSDP